MVAEARKLDLNRFIDGIDRPELAACHMEAKADYPGGRAWNKGSDSLSVQRVVMRVR